MLCQCDCWGFGSSVGRRFAALVALLLLLPLNPAIKKMATAAAAAAVVVLLLLLLLLCSPNCTKGGNSWRQLQLLRLLHTSVCVLLLGSVAI
jgi:uncharacterized membrane protein YwaF